MIPSSTILRWISPTATLMLGLSACASPEEEVDISEFDVTEGSDYAVDDAAEDVSNDQARAEAESYAVETEGMTFGAAGERGETSAYETERAAQETIGSTGESRGGYSGVVAGTADTTSVGATGERAGESGYEIDQAAERAIGSSGKGRGGYSGSTEGVAANEVGASGERTGATGMTPEQAAAATIGSTGMSRGGASDLRDRNELTSPSEVETAQTSDMTEDTTEPVRDETAGATGTTDEGLSAAEKVAGAAAVGAAATDEEEAAKEEAAATAAAGESCDIEVVAKSHGAVGDPCATTKDFMESIGLSQEAMDLVARINGRLEERGGAAAH